MRDVLLAICQGAWDEAEQALSREADSLRQDAACANLRGIVWQARGQWRRARRCYGRAMRCDSDYVPAEQNLRRIYELETFGRTRYPPALIDRRTLGEIRTAFAASDHGAGNLARLDTLKSLSPLTRPHATIPGVMVSRDWRGFAWAVITVALATAAGWPLVHSQWHMPNLNVLMLYLLSVIWVSTHHSRGAAVLASVLGVAAFDFVFVEPYFTFAVADEQYLFSFAAMLVTALVISTLTDRMRRQSILTRQAWERVETEFLRNTLLSGVSHELRTPLATISGASSTLIQAGSDLDPATREDLLKTISLQSERMERLITNLLEMTRVESGSLNLKREWQPIQEVVGSSLNHLDRSLGDRRVNIHISPGLPLVQIDSVAIEHVLTNLLENAVQHTPADAPIDIEAHALAGELVVEVADRGPGLPPGTEERVFEKFFQARPGARGGVGLGLAIARGVVEAHGGRIRAANRPGGGAAFTFSIPLSVPPPPVDTSG